MEIPSDDKIGIYKFIGLITHILKNHSQETWYELLWLA